SAVLAGVAPEALRERHARLAAALEQSGRADPETLMFHFQGARDAAKTAQYAIVAGERSAAALAFHSAAGFYRVAIGTGPPAAPSFASRAASCALLWADIAGASAPKVKSRPGNCCASTPAGQPRKDWP